MSNECEHGQLARNCNICEYEQEIAELEAQLAELKDENANLRMRAQAVVDDNHYCTDKKPDNRDSYGVNGVLLWLLRRALPPTREST